MGALVSSLAGGITDVDAGSLKGLAITGADTTLGAWYYSLDNGGTWAAIGAVAEASALLLRPSDRVYFQPSANINGAVAAGLTFRAWDQSTGSAGNKTDTGSNGGTSAFSTATDSIPVTIRAVNDAPTRLLASVPLAATPEDAASPSQATVASLFNGAGANAAFSDATDQVLPGGSSANQLAGVVIVGNSADAATEGVWQYSADGASWTTVTNSVTPGAGVFITPNYQLRFVPVTDYNGTPPGLTVRLVDDAAVTPALPAPAPQTSTSPAVAARPVTAITPTPSP